MIKERKLFDYYKEMALAEESFVSSANLECVSDYIDFPSDVRGLFILDIGGGASSAALELRKRGAHAFAIDYMYGSLKGLKRSVDQYLVDTYRLGDREYTKHSRKARDRFFDAFQGGYKPYAAGLAGFLPFRENVFDFCFSLQCIGNFLIRDEDVLIRTVSESLRILKSGGQLQIHPWENWDYYIDEGIRRQSAEGLRQYLEEKRVPYSIETVESKLFPRLRVHKP